MPIVFGEYVPNVLFGSIVGRRGLTQVLGCTKHLLARGGFMKYITSLAALMLAACAMTGIRDETSLSSEVETSMSYEAAYRFADEYARKCHLDQSGVIQRALPIVGNIFPDNKTAIVRVQTGDAANDFQRFEIKETHPGNSTVTITVANQSTFNQEELDRAVRAFSAGQIPCRRSD